MAEVPGDRGARGQDGQRVPIEIVAAVGELRRWAATLPSDAEPRERHEPRRAVTDAIVEALHRRMLGTGAAATSEVVLSLISDETDVLRTIDDVRAARDTLHRRLVVTLPPALAFQAVEELNELADEVLREATDHALRNLHVDAFTDVLTGAANRRAFERDFRRVLETSRRHGRQLTVVVIDLDGLKRLNDEQGHAAGDQALRDLATAFSGHLRAGDGLYRIGGDEFALLLPESGAEAVEALLERARQAAPSFSYGWAAHPDDGPTSTELLQRADERLFEGRHMRRTTPTPAAPVRAGDRLQLVAATLPVLVALGLAELVRRTVGVELRSALVQSWVGLLILGGLLGPPVARRWCSGHPDATATAVCATRVGVVVLLILVGALVPVSRLRKAIDMAALQRDAPAERPDQPDRGVRSSGPTVASPVPPSAPTEVATGPLDTAVPPRSPPSTGRPQLVLGTPRAAPVLGLTSPETPDVLPPVPFEPAPTSTIGTKTPGVVQTRPLVQQPVAENGSHTGGPRYRTGKRTARPRVAGMAAVSARPGGGASKKAARHGRQR